MRIEFGTGTVRSLLKYGNPPLSWPESQGACEQSLWDWTRCRASVLFAITLLFSAACLSAQNYSIDWHTIDGGGGTSTGGVYSVSGTIGQPDAGTMSGGSYSLAGGFWGIITAIQTPGAPLLTIHHTTGNRAVVSWPSPSTGFTLQQNANLNTGSWATPSEAVTDNGTNKFIIVNPPLGNRYYRLIKP